MPKSDIEIAREATMQPIAEVGAKLDIPADAIVHYGPHKGKISFDFIDGLKDRSDGKLILVTAITPTPAGEGKTTTSVGLGDGLNRIGKKTAVCLREPSLGPCFGMKGGAILIKRVRPEGEGKIAAAEFAANAGLTTGARLG